jgi:hypothetical protein
MRLLILIGLAVISGSLWHRVLARFWLASAAATVTTVVVFMVSSYSGWIDLGPRTLCICYFVLAEVLHTDFLTAVLVFDVVGSLLLAFVAAALIGLVPRAQRKCSGAERHS